MSYSSTNMHFISVVLFAVVYRSAKTEMSARDVYDILSGKIGSLSFDMELLRSDLREIKGRVTVIDKLLTDIATDKSDGTILDEHTSHLAVSHGDINVSSIHSKNYLADFQRVIKKAIKDEKVLLRRTESRLEHSIEFFNNDIRRRLQEAQLYKNKDITTNSENIEKQAQKDEQFQEALLKMDDRISNIEKDATTLRRHMVSRLPIWGDWQSWSACTYNCTNGGRTQTRIRRAVCSEDLPCSETTSETERRPCNAVQFAGCISDYGTTDNFGVTYDFADQLAQSTCIAIMDAGGHVRAVRRQCSNSAPDCNAICRAIGTTCFNSLHVYRSSPTLPRKAVGKKGLLMYRYNGCSGSFCGPNFCCCRGL